MSEPKATYDAGDCRPAILGPDAIRKLTKFETWLTNFLDDSEHAPAEPIASGPLNDRLRAISADLERVSGMAKHAGADLLVRELARIKATIDEIAGMPT